VLTVKKKRSTLGNPISIDEDGLLLDIDVQPIDNARPTREEKRRDVDEFFHPAVSKVINGKTKSYCICRCCPNEKMLVNEVTTLRCHLEAQHSVSLFFVYLLLHYYYLYRANIVNGQILKSSNPNYLATSKIASLLLLQYCRPLLSIATYQSRVLLNKWPHTLISFFTRSQLNGLLPQTNPSEHSSTHSSRR
jgi:hypothetical protein